MKNKLIRIQKFIANNSSLSRRSVEKLIKEEKILVNGTKAILGQKIDDGKNEIEVDGIPVNFNNQEITIIFNKPKGIIVTKKDPQKRQTIYEILPTKYRDLNHIGRLDKNSEGLLLLTSNGELCYRLSHPSYEIEKEYIVDITGVPSKQAIGNVLAGITTDNIFIKPKLIKINNQISQNNCQLKIILTEGKKREIRKLIKYLGFEVIRLNRIRIANIHLNDLRGSSERILQKDELQILKKMVGL